MHIKRFVAETALAAVQQVKQELGPDALVLEVRKARAEGSWFGRLARPMFEVVAAVDRDPRTIQAAPPMAPDRVAPDPSWNELRLNRALIDPITQELRSLRAEVERLRRRPEPRTPQPAPVAGDGADSPERRAASRLVALGLAPRHARALTRDAPADPCSALARALESCVGLPRADTAPPVELFVGPSGVGKTTTLAKLAARDSAETPLSILTTDTHRIAGEAQLRAYAGLLGLPFEVAASPDQLERQVGARAGRRILVDSAGRRSADPAAMDALRLLRDAAGADARLHLVLAATSKEEDLRAELDHYASLKPDSLILTKLDESTGIASALNVMLEPDVPPLLWVGSGQRVPEDLGVADPRDLAARLIGVAA